MDVTPDELRRYAARERLRDGRGLLIRAIRPEDKAALEEGLRRLSDDSAYSRFFSVKREPSRSELVYFTEVDFSRHVALVASVEEAPQIIVGVGRYIVGDGLERGRVAEIAFAFDDAHQGLGIATILLGHLVKIARTAGIAAFSASVMADNSKMLRVFARAGLPAERKQEGGEVEVRLSLVERPSG